MKKLLLLFILCTFMGVALSQNHILMKYNKMEQDSPEINDLILQLKEIVSKEARNRNIDVDKYIYLGFHDIFKVKGNDEYHVSFSAVDPALFPYRKGNLSKEYPNFSVYIDKETRQVIGLFYSK